MSGEDAKNFNGYIEEVLSEYKLALDIYNDFQEEPGFALHVYHAKMKMQETKGRLGQIITHCENWGISCLGYIAAKKLLEPQDPIKSW